MPKAGRWVAGVAAMIFTLTAPAVVRAAVIPQRSRTTRILRERAALPSVS